MVAQPDGRDGLSLDALIAAAREADQQQDWVAATRLWEQVRSQAPTMPQGYSSGANALVNQRRFDEADILLEQARSTLPPDLWIMRSWAALAHRRGRPEDAVKRFQVMIQNFPDEPVCYSGLSSVLIDLRRLDEAEALIRSVRSHMDGFVWLAHNYALAASVRRDWPEAASRWQSVCTEFPDHQPAYSHLADALRYGNRWADADALLTRAVARFPAEFDLAMRWAQSAHDAPDVALAVTRLHAVTERFPHRPKPYVMLVTRLRGMGQNDEADAVAREAYQRIPSNAGIAKLYVQSAFRQARFDVGSRRQQEVLESHLTGYQPGWLTGTVSSEPKSVSLPTEVNLRSALAVPTYRRHFVHAQKLITSIYHFCDDGNRPSLMVGVSDKQEREDFIALLRTELGSKVDDIDVIALPRSDVVLRSDPLEPISPAKRPFATRCSIINYKKLALAAACFSRGHDVVAMVDSEAHMFRTGDLAGSIRRGYLKHEYRFSYRAIRNGWLAEVQRASVQSVWPGISDQHFLQRTYGWYNTYCLYERRSFEQFTSHLLKSGTTHWLPPSDPELQQDVGFQLAMRLRPNSFEWIAYIAFVLLTVEPPLSLIDLDSVLDMFGIAASEDNASWSEVLWRLMAECEGDSRFLTAFDPRWLPSTEDSLMLQLVEQCLSTDVCMMFHSDRV